jgi:hypothetical protein
MELVPVPRSREVCNSREENVQSSAQDDITTVLPMRHVGNTNHSHSFDMKYELDLKRILHITLSSLRPKPDSMSGNLKAFQKIC